MRALWGIRLLVLLFLLSAGFALSSCDDDDDDDESPGDDQDDDTGDDDAGDDDAGDDSGDDDDSGHPCEDLYDVIVRGDYAEDFGWVTTWTSKYVILEDQTTVGVVIPDAAGWEAYEATGARTAPGAGFSDGAFPRPEELRLFCTEETVQVHVEYTVSGDVFSGVATYRCANTLGPYALVGAVVCGDP